MTGVRSSEVEALVRRLAIPPGPRVLKAELRYQACSDTDCLGPRTVRFDVPLTVMTRYESAAEPDEALRARLHAFLADPAADIDALRAAARRDLEP
jgi:hypothetical protein